MAHHASHPTGDAGGVPAATTFVLRCSGEPVELIHLIERAGEPVVALVRLPGGRRRTVLADDLATPAPTPIFRPAEAKAISATA